MRRGSQAGAGSAAQPSTDHSQNPRVQTPAEPAQPAARRLPATGRQPLAGRGPAPAPPGTSLRTVRGVVV